MGQQTVKTKTLKMPKGSGLTKPLNLSTELADLVGAKKGEKLSRPEVVKRLWAHIKNNKLQDPEQAVLHSRRQDDSHLRKGQGSCLRYGQVPQDSPDILNIIIISVIKPKMRRKKVKSYQSYSR